MGGLIVHEWIARHGGSENVFVAIAETFPDADLFALWSDRESVVDGRRAKVSWLAGSPLRRNKALALPVMPWVWRSVIKRDANYDWVIASSHAFAHHVDATRGSGPTPKLVYAHTPARYVWTPELDLRGASRAARAAAALLKPIDRKRAQEAASIAANSHYVRQRVRDAWGRDARVIYPPVDTERIGAVTSWRDCLDGSDDAVFAALPESFILAASRFVSYKRLDVAIRSAKLTGLPVVVAGTGPEDAALRDYAASSGVESHFVHRPSSPLLFALYEAAIVYVFVGIEDFGIMPVEAMAAGAPVVANRLGGAAESVIEGLSGHLVDPDSDSELRAAVEAAALLPRAAIRTSAARFSVARFRREIEGWTREYS